MLSLTGPPTVPPTTITVTTAPATHDPLQEAVDAARDQFEAQYGVETADGSPMLGDIDGEKVYAWTVDAYLQDDVAQTIAAIITRHDGVDYTFTVTAPIDDSYPARESLRLLALSVRWH